MWPSSRLPLWLIHTIVRPVSRCLTTKENTTTTPSFASSMPCDRLHDKNLVFVRRLYVTTRSNCRAGAHFPSSGYHLAALRQSRTWFTFRLVAVLALQMPVPLLSPAAQVGLGPAVLVDACYRTLPPLLAKLNLRLLASARSYVPRQVGFQNNLQK